MVAQAQTCQYIFSSSVSHPICPAAPSHLRAGPGDPVLRTRGVQDLVWSGASPACPCRLKSRVRVWKGAWLAGEGSGAELSLSSTTGTPLRCRGKRGGSGESEGVPGQADLEAGLAPAVIGMGTLAITPFLLSSFPPSPLAGPEHSLQQSQWSPNPGF